MVQTPLRVVTNTELKRSACMEQTLVDCSLGKIRTVKESLARVVPTRGFATIKSNSASTSLEDRIAGCSAVIQTCVTTWLTFDRQWRLCKLRQKVLQ